MAGRFKYDGLRMPIVAVSKADDPEPDVHKSTWSCSVYVVVVLFGMSASLGLDALWVTAPTSTAHLPEDARLKTYLIGFFIFGNIGSMIYLATYCCIPHRRHCPPEMLPIYGCLLLALVSSALLAVFWNDQAGLRYKGHDIVYIGTALCLSQVACLAAVTYVPFAASLKPVYLSGIFMGEALAKLLTHLVALGEGIGEPPACRPEIPANLTWILLRGWRARFRPTTTLPPIIPPPLRFDEAIFFFVVTGVLCLAAFSFLVLRCIPAVRFEYDQVPIDSMDEYEMSHPMSRQLTRDDREHIAMSTLESSSSTHVSIQEDNTVRYTTYQGLGNSINHLVHKKSTHTWNSPKSTIAFKGQARNTARKPVSRRSNQAMVTNFPKAHHVSSGRLTKGGLSPYRPPSMCLMLTFTFWACLVVSGPLSSTKAHVCLPRGNRAFQSGTLLTQLASILAVLVSTRVNPYSRVTMVVAFTSLATIVLTYFVALISFSHESESREDSPIFMNTGELLTTIAWTAVCGLFYFTRTMVAVLLRQHNKDMLVWYAAVSLLGTSLGSLFMLDNINICRIYRDFDKLYCKSSSS